VSKRLRKRFDKMSLSGSFPSILKKGGMMKMKCQMQRLLVIIFCLFALGSSVYASPVEIDFWHLFGGGDRDVMEKLIDRFNSEQHDVHLNARLIPNATSYYDALALGMVAGSPPAVAIMHIDRLMAFNMNNFLTALTPNDLNDMGLSQDSFYPPLWQGAQYEGKHYAVPFDFLSLGLYMNVDLFAQAGIIPSMPATEANLLDTIRKLVKDHDGDGKFDQGGIGWSWPSAMWFGFLNQFGGAVNPDGSINNKQAGIRAMQLIQAIWTANQSRSIGSFQRKTVAMQFGGSWNSGAFVKAGINLKTNPFPQFGEKKAIAASGHTLVIPAGWRGKDPKTFEAAKKFISWLSNNSVYWAKEAGHVPANRSQLMDRIFQSLEHTKPFAFQMPYAIFGPDFRIVWESTTISGGLSKFLSGDVPPEQFIENAELEFRNLMSTIGEVKSGK
jgi:multiple sugar transport system substrate-binding protein